MEADISSQAVGLASSADFSLINLFIRADIIVKSVIVMLIACSIYSWAVIIEKIKLFKKINQSTEEFETKFWNSKSAESFYNNLPANIEDPMALVFKDAMQNLLKKRSKTDLHDRMTTMLETGIEKQISKIGKGYTFLATVGSTAPFIGLFGTVWGIMNSFQSIAISRNTSLAIVAPGIAEALFATALGLLAAIPAVTIIISSFMKVDKTNIFQLIGLLLSVIGISSIISNADINKILDLNFNKGDLWMLVCVICWSLYSTLLKKHSFKFSQFTLIQLMVSVGIVFLIPQFFYERSIGLEVNFNKAFFIILFYVVIFPALAAYYCWQKGIEIVGPNRATMFIQLMPLLSAVLAIIIFREKFEMYHLAGAIFILTGIYLSNRKVNA